MTTLLDEPPTQVSSPPPSPAERLRITTAATRVTIRWFGVRKALTAEQKSQAARAFGAEGEFLSAGKKLVNTKHPAFQAVTAVRNNAVRYWKSLTLPYPEPGLRLIRHDRIDEFDGRMREFAGELQEAVSQLDAHFDELRAAARQRLGRLYNPADYPASLAGLFAIEHEFPAVEPPDYLLHVSPRLYEQETQRIRQRFDEAVQLAEQAFLGELSKLVSHLVERLSGQFDGKPKVFRDSAVGNLREFFERFRELNVRSSEDLDAVVEQAQQIVQGIAPQSLRENHMLRQSVAHELQAVQGMVDDLLVDRPRRNIIRRPR